MPFDDIDVLLVPDVPAVPLAEPVVEPVELLAPGSLEDFAFVSTHFTPAGAEVAELAPVVPVVPVALDALPAGSRQPVTLTVFDELLDDELDVPLCAYTATAQPTISAIDAPQRFRFMRASFAPRECN